VSIIDSVNTTSYIICYNYYSQEYSMTTTEDRMRTTHIGSLPRPQALLDLLEARQNGDAVDEDE